MTNEIPLGAVVSLADDPTFLGKVVHVNEEYDRVTVVVRKPGTQRCRVGWTMLVGMGDLVTVSLPTKA